MKTIISAVAVLLVVASLAIAQAQSNRTEVRSPSGKLLYTTTRKGDTTEVRKPSGKLLFKSKTLKGKTEIRSPSGRLLETIKKK
jgi:hypothetical protein